MAPVLSVTEQSKAKKTAGRQRTGGRGEAGEGAAQRAWVQLTMWSFWVWHRTGRRFSSQERGEVGVGKICGDGQWAQGRGIWVEEWAKRGGKIRKEVCGVSEHWTRRKGQLTGDMVSTEGSRWSCNGKSFSWRRHHGMAAVQLAGWPSAKTPQTQVASGAEAARWAGRRGV